MAEHTLESASFSSIASGHHVTAGFGAGAGDTFIWHSQVVWKDSDSTHCNFIGIQYIAYYLGAWVDEVA